LPKKDKKDKVIEEEAEEEEAPKEAPAPPDTEEETEGEEEEGEEENEEEEEEGEEETEAEEEDEEDEDADDDLEEDDKKEKGKKKNDLDKMISDMNADKFAKFSAIAGGVGIVILLFGMALDILEWILPFGGFIITCFTCLIWSVFFIGFLGAVLGIVIGIVALVKGTEEKKMMAFLGIGLGAGYFFLVIAWIIISIFAPW